VPDGRESSREKKKSEKGTQEKQQTKKGIERFGIT